MYRVIVVDDEALIRERICKKMDWEKIGYELVGKFEDGKTAKEFLEANPVDMVLTDICMPYMDGIALSEYIYMHMPHVKVIIFSGFDDFEYAQKAIHYQVEEYLLKPVTALQLSEVLTKQKKKMDEERTVRENHKKLNRVVNKNKIYLQSQGLQKLFGGSSPVEEALAELKEHGIELFGSSFYAVILRMSESGSQSTLFQFIAYNMVSEFVKERELGESALGYECDIYILFCNQHYSAEQFKQEVGLCLEKIVTAIQENMRIEARIAVGVRVSTLAEINHSCRTALESLKHAQAGKEAQILWAQDSETGGAQNRIVMLAMEYLLENYARPELTLTEVCSHLGVSVTRFSANFKNRYNETFTEALGRIRMEEAKRLLAETDLKNYEIAERVGFTDPHYFSIVFKKVTGKTPTEWGREHA